jgi:hypothetical protein
MLEGWLAREFRENRPYDEMTRRLLMARGDDAGQASVFYSAVGGNPESYATAFGLLENTLIIWMSEFGRTPLINNNNGRDHFPLAWSTVPAGGGVRGGQVIGSTTDDAMQVKDRPVKSPNLLPRSARRWGWIPGKRILRARAGPFAWSTTAPNRFGNLWGNGNENPNTSINFQTNSNDQMSEQHAQAILAIGILDLEFVCNLELVHWNTPVGRRG